MPSTLDKSPDRPERAPEAAGGDLVERLRGGGPEWRLEWEAADEIERLDEFSKGLQMQINNLRLRGTDDWLTKAADEQQRAEAAEAELVRVHSEKVDHFEARIIAEAEVARYRKALIWIHDKAETLTDAREIARGTIQALAQQEQDPNAVGEDPDDWQHRGV